MFLHLSPSGDHWVGSGLYAAKHNPSDYVRSLPLPPNRTIAEDVPPEALHAMYDANAVDAAHLAPVWAAGPPVAALAPPGACVLGEEFAACALRERTWISEDTVLVTFALPDAGAPLGLSTCACVLARAGDAVRPYTPVSTNAALGSFELMVKVYEGGALSAHLAALDVGASVDFKHVPFNVKIQYPFAAKKLGMLVGGTGIAPMLQALHALLGTAGDATETSMLYGSQVSGNILAGDVVDAWAAAFPDRFSATHVLSHEPADSDWEGARGFIDRDLIARHIPAPGEDCLIFVCGPPAMYEALCGPRGEEELSGVLAEMGYRGEQIVKF